ncbi:MAG: Mpv17/PMP22 family protein, partial [Promethearchaeia archaeon]
MKASAPCGQRRGGAGGCSMSAMHDAMTLAAAAQAVVAMPHEAYSIYMGALDANALAVDTGTASLLYMLGKLTSKAFGADSAQLKNDQVLFLARWGVLGLCDGLCTHHWYGLLQSMVNIAMPSASELTAGFAMAAMSALVYTPAYSAAFLLLLTLLEGESWERAAKRVRLDTGDLAMRTFKVWGPTNVMLFTFVPLELRTAVSMLIHYVFLVGVAVWDSSVRAQRGTCAAAGPEVAEVGSMREVLNLRAATCFV